MWDFRATMNASSPQCSSCLSRLLSDSDEPVVGVSRGPSQLHKFTAESLTRDPTTTGGSWTLPREPCRQLGTSPHRRDATTTTTTAPGQGYSQVLYL
uniref:Uncharacterized protein n=1 Tax=Knipowitschia caucasica TaxID=637954 RepID=A0AAV2JFD8_KNICA